MTEDVITLGRDTIVLDNDPEILEEFKDSLFNYVGQKDKSIYVCITEIVDETGFPDGYRLPTEYPIFHFKSVNFSNDLPLIFDFLNLTKYKNIKEFKKFSFTFNRYDDGNFGIKIKPCYLSDYEGSRFPTTPIYTFLDGIGFAD